jgi:crotonobetainyl-CoA:carnitine CoA-transferase CaiB-like acyl-CoA transferase
MSTGPLAGIRILDLSIAATGPLACALLADQGADVVKIERPGIGDIGRWVGVSVNGMSALYAACNRGKRCIAVDVHTDDGRELVLRMARGADVFVQNFRPGVMDRVGLGADAVRAVNPDIVYVSLSGFGAEGPYADKSAYDTVIQAYGGFATTQADPAVGDPVFIRQTAADKVTALTASQAITAALLARERGHGGQHVELAMLDAVVSFLWADAAGNEVLMDSPGTAPSSFVASFRPFRFVDGWGIATPTSDGDFVGIMRAFGIDGAEDPRVGTIAERVQHPDMVRRMMDDVYVVAATLTTEQAMARLEAQRVPCGVVLSPAQLVHDPHAVAVRMFVEQRHPIAGRVRLPRHPIRFAVTPAALGGPAPGLGEHTDELLAELGLADRAEEWRSGGVVA